MTLLRRTYAGMALVLVVGVSVPAAAAEEQRGWLGRVASSFSRARLGDKVVRSLATGWHLISTGFIVADVLNQTLPHTERLSRAATVPFTLMGAAASLARDVVPRPVRYAAAGANLGHAVFMHFQGCEAPDAALMGLYLLGPELKAGARAVHRAVVQPIAQRLRARR
ncbi:MAG: hypothetical protein IT371_26825 [Deltaproteobacteria bacterium]|nr:hypothetical protein [Deltaproteobacteria bacterium]